MTTRNLVIGVNILLQLTATAKCSDFNAAIAVLCFIRLLSPFTLFCLTFACLSLTKDAENVFRLSFGVFHRLSPTFTVF